MNNTQLLYEIMELFWLNYHQWFQTVSFVSSPATAIWLALYYFSDVISFLVHSQESLVASWYDTQIIDQIMCNKLVFVETRDAVETAAALENYYEVKYNITRPARYKL